MVRTIAITRCAGFSYYSKLRECGVNILEITPETKLRQFDECDGLVLPGGRDVCPDWYGEEPNQHTQPPDLNRDSLELALCKRALNLDMPILGVCRGHQVLNVALGGTLLQNIEDHVVSRHKVSIEPDSFLGFVAGEPEMYVNSLHHQAIGQLGRNLRVIAKAEDGTIEAIQSKKHKWVVGVQWHPEMGLTPRFNREMAELWRIFSRARSS